MECPEQFGTEIAKKKKNITTVYDFNQVTEWHKKMEETRLQELRKGRELVLQKEEIRYLKNLVNEQEETIRSLEEDIVQLNTVRKKTFYTRTHSQICSFLHLYAHDSKELCRNGE